MKQRIEYMDLAKGICILLVVLYHICIAFHKEMPIGHVFKAIRIPLYFFLSGCFFKPYNGWLDFIKHKTNKLLIPFVFWFFLISMLFAYLYGQWGIPILTRKPIAFDHNLRNLVHGRFFINLPIWFLLCLFETNLLFYIIHAIAHKVFQRHRTLVIVVLSLMVGVIALLVNRQGISLPLFINRAIASIPFFAFGYICFHNTGILKPSRYDKFIPLIIIALFLSLYFIAPRENAMALTHVDTINYFTYHLSGCVGALLIILLSKWLKTIPIIRWWGRYSIITLILHGFFYLHIVYLGRRFHLLPDTWTSVLITLCLTMLCCSSAIPIVKGFLPHVTAQKDLLK